MGDRRVGVTGLGAVTALGIGVEAFEAGLRRGKSGIRALAAGDMPELGAPRIGAPCAFDLGAFRADCGGLAPEIAEAVRPELSGADGRALAITLTAAIEAAQNARLLADPRHAERTAVLVGGSNLGLAEAAENSARHARNPAFVRPRYGYRLFDSHCASLLATALGSRGPTLTVSGATASGSYAVAIASDMIRLGRADIAVAVGPMAAFSAAEWQALKAIGALVPEQTAADPDSACRPFDAGAAGFVPGEGAGCIVLEEAGHARRRGAPVLAEIAGSAMTSDGTALPGPNADGEYRAMAGALAQAGIGVDALDYINAHATSTPLGDRAECDAIARLIAGTEARPWINGTKGLIGHTLFASGVLGAIAAILQIRGGFVHPNRNLAEPIDPALRFVGDCPVQAAIDCALVNAFGFGGLSASIVLRR